VPFVGVRRRSPDRVTPMGPGLTALAWAGWTTSIDLARLAHRPEWRLRIALATAGVRRDQPLGLGRGPLAEQPLIEQRYVGSSLAAELGQGPRGGLVLRVQPRVPSRRLPAGSRAVLKRLRQAVPAATRRT